MARIKTVCCECGTVIHDGPTKDGMMSHGYCDQCTDIILAFINGEKIDDEFLFQIKTISP